MYLMKYRRVHVFNKNCIHHNATTNEEKTLVMEAEMEVNSHEHAIELLKRWNSTPCWHYALVDIVRS